jgi:hypothetical protein
VEEVMPNTYVKYRDLIGPDFKGLIDIAMSLSVEMMYRADDEMVISLSSGNILVVSMAEEDK